jgi:hypothetical protein
MALYLAECGVHTHMLPAIRDYLIRQGWAGQDLDSQYQQYVIEKRQMMGVDYGLAQSDLGPPLPEEGHPFAQFRGSFGMSKSGFAKTFCVHPAALNKLEKGDAVHLPEQLREALTQAGVPVNVIDELNERCQEYAHGGWTAAA